eukprot:TRINITY_DN7455_c2_g1_i12.p1 TRINITY_DN7455_c2_g1~~TRINITY_DN7455_c2_g1_i12.p1  ORF type:complete len:718 (+),score=151.89 TRINITY_DN7455_c2_g1_i12:63-2156(+)
MEGAGLLLGQRCSVTKKNKMGQTAAHLAAANGRLDFLKFLLVQVLNSTETMNLVSWDNKGFNSLHLAVIKGHTHCLRQLYPLCRDVSDWVGLNALDRSILSGNVECATELMRLGMWKCHEPFHPRPIELALQKFIYRSARKKRNHNTQFDSKKRSVRGGFDGDGEGGGGGSVGGCGAGSGSGSGGGGGGGDGGGGHVVVGEPCGVGPIDANNTSGLGVSSKIRRKPKSNRSSKDLEGETKKGSRAIGDNLKINLSEFVNAEGSNGEGFRFNMIASETEDENKADSDTSQARGRIQGCSPEMIGDRQSYAESSTPKNPMYFTDVIFSFPGGHIVSCHKVILSQSSLLQNFWTREGTNVVEMHLHWKFSFRVFLLLIEFLYTAECFIINSIELYQLFSLADWYHLPFLEAALVPLKQGYLDQNRLYTLHAPNAMSPLCNHLSKFVNQPTYSDVILIVGKKKIYAHKVVIYSRSSYLRNLIDTNPTTKIMEIFFPGESVNDNNPCPDGGSSESFKDYHWKSNDRAFMKILEYIYTSTVRNLLPVLTPGDVIDMIKMARYMGEDKFLVILQLLLFQEITLQHLHLIIPIAFHPTVKLRGLERLVEEFLSKYDSNEIKEFTNKRGNDKAITEHHHGGGGGVGGDSGYGLSTFVVNLSFNRMKEQMKHRQRGKKNNLDLPPLAEIFWKDVTEDSRNLEEKGKN